MLDKSESGYIAFLTSLAHDPVLSELRWVSVPVTWVSRELDLGQHVLNIVSSLTI